MAAEIVHDHQVARFEGRDENLIDIGAEDHAVDRAVDDAGRGEPVAAQRRQEGEGPPFAERRLGDQTLTFGAPPVRARHVRLRPGLVDEDEGPDRWSPDAPSTAYAGGRRPADPVRMREGSFLNVTPSC